MATKADETAITDEATELDRDLERIAEAVKHTSGVIDWQGLSRHVAWFDRPDAHDRVREKTGDNFGESNSTPDV